MYNAQLETFIRVADAGSFSKAAELLYISSNAVIKQINLLETQLDLRLFVRSHRGIALTPAGESLYRDAKYIIEYAKESITRAKNAIQNSDRIIRIGTSLTTPPQVLVEIWPQMQSHCPDLKFQLVSFENTPENAVEIMRNFGQNIDLVAGIYDDVLLRQRNSAGLELSKEPICCAVPIRHRLAEKEKLDISDLFGENLMMIHRNWNGYVDLLRDDLNAHYPQISIVDFPFYNVEVFNQCEHSNHILMAVRIWENIHPLLKIIPVEWDYVVPFGLIFSPEPSENVKMFLKSVAHVYNLEY